MFDKKVSAACYLLPYSVMLLREGGEENCLKAKELLKLAEKAPDLNEERRRQLYANYAVAQYKLGNLAQAINLLEASHKRGPCGMTYGSLGFLYIEAGDVEKALAYNQEALDYDDEDSIFLDNMGQLYYRLIGDKEKALPYFKKAIAIRDRQIDTLYFLSRYDLDSGDKAAAVQKLRKALESNFSPLNYCDRPMIVQELRNLGETVED